MQIWGLRVDSDSFHPVLYPLRHCTYLQLKNLTAAVREPGSFARGAASQNTETLRFATGKNFICEATQ